MSANETKPLITVLWPCMACQETGSHLGRILTAKVSGWKISSRHNFLAINYVYGHLDTILPRLLPIVLQT